MTPWKDKVFIIAEAGVNHNGDINLALQLVDAAADAGADAVKFQTFHAEALVAPDAVMADYQKQNTGKEESQFAMLKRLELSSESHHLVKQRAIERGILFFSTAFDLASIEVLRQLDIPLWKIPSGEITNYPYLCQIGALNLPTILSTGMADLGEVEDAVNVLVDSGLQREKLCILHCNTEYPTPMHDVNLRAMITLGQAFGVSHGYSDHTAGLEISVAATALGAVVIEKHFTLDCTLPGPDHVASLEPKELATMIAAIRNIELAMGNGIKRPTQSEAKNIAVARKSIVAANTIKAGEIFTEANLTIKRPGNGISPMNWPDLLGRVATIDYATDELIQW